MRHTADTLRRTIASDLRVAFNNDDRATAAGVDARVIVGHVLGLAPGQLAVMADKDIAPAQAERALGMARRRAEGIPVGRLLGRQDFYGLDLELGAATLIPRPDTETVVDAALAFVDEGGSRDRRVRALDLGTGAGGILLALADNVPGLVGVGIDISEDAVATAAANAVACALAGRVTFAVGDWGGAVAERFDVVVANPPYIASDAIASLQPEVRDHEPRQALDGGPDGLAAYRAILPDLDRLVADGGAAFVEIGFDQADAVTRRAEALGWRARVHQDLAGRDRVVALRR